MILRRECAEARASFLPTPRVRSSGWFVEQLKTHDDKPYDAGVYPHLTAPGGPCDALDDEKVQTIWLQWGARLGKTFFAQCGMLFMAEIKPCQMMHANADEDIAKEVVLRTYGMMENSACMRKHLKPKHQRRQDRIDFLRCRAFVAWARSVSKLADKGIKYGHGGEIDKWDHAKTSEEADPLKLFTERGKEFQDRKFILESTPAQKHNSRVERGRLDSTNCQYFVPCPHCRRYQHLEMGSPETKHGVKWDKLPNGRSDKALAKQTAYYVCIHCEQKILDHHRAPMMQMGVWVPEGCTVKDDAAHALFEPGGSRPPAGWSLATWIQGTPARDSADAGYQLSSLHALTLTWGDIAAEFVGCKDKPHLLRNFKNSWLAETWEEFTRRETWETVGIKIIDRELPRGVVPIWASLLTFASDRQGDKFPYSFEAWGPDRRNATIFYGHAKTFDELAELLRREWPHADGGAKLRPAIALVDRGYRPDGVHEFCLKMRRQKIKAFAVRGSSVALDGDLRVLTCGVNTSNANDKYFELDTIRSQLWLDHAMYDLQSGDEGAISLHAGSLEEHEEYLQQLINDHAKHETDSHNNARESWVRLNANIPNDWRDTKRYNYGGMLVITGCGPIAPRGQPAAPSKTERRAEEPPPARRGGATREMKRRW